MKKKTFFKECELYYQSNKFKKETIKKDAYLI